MNETPRFAYTYREGETPEERLRNKIQPLFTLVSMLEAGATVSPEVISLSRATVTDIRSLLNDIVPFYTVDYPGHLSFTQSDTLEP
jgi:hypothetical protein